MSDLSQAYQGLLSVSDNWCGIDGLTQCPNCNQLISLGQQRSTCPYCLTLLNLVKTNINSGSTVDHNFQQSLMNMSNRCANAWH